jgi:hypothetical protein
MKTTNQQPSGSLKNKSTIKDNCFIVNDQKNKSSVKETQTTPQKEKLTGKEFRSTSMSVLKNKTERKNSAPEERQACHKVPNSILKNAYNNTKFKNVKEDLLDFGYSKENIFYSKNNSKHSKMERELAKETCTQSTIQQKGKSIQNALEKLHHKQTSSATTHVMKDMVKQGPGYVEIVAKLDKRKFNNSSEKKVIDDARKIFSGEKEAPEIPKKPTVNKNTSVSKKTPSTPKKILIPTVRPNSTTTTAQKYPIVDLKSSKNHGHGNGSKSVQPTSGSNVKRKNQMLEGKLNFNSTSVNLEPKCEIITKSTPEVFEKIKETPKFIPIESQSFRENIYNAPSLSQHLFSSNDKHNMILHNFSSKPMYTPSFQSFPVQDFFGNGNSFYRSQNHFGGYPTFNSFGNSYHGSFSSYGSNSFQGNSSFSDVSSSNVTTRFYKGGQFIPGGGRAPKGGCHVEINF